MDNAVSWILALGFLAILLVLVITGERQNLSSQTCFVYCPRCERDLCSTEGVECTDTDFVRYVCVCDFRSIWDFDTYPVPVLVLVSGEDHQ